MRLLEVEDCEYIKKIYSEYDEENPHKVHDFETVLIRFRKENSAKYVIIRDKEPCDYVFEKIKEYIPNLKQITNLKIMKYYVGDALAKHQDFNRYGVAPIYKTVLVQLSDSNEYDGGDLII